MLQQTPCRPRAAGVRDMDGPLAHTERPCSRSTWRRRPRVGATRLPETCTATARSVHSLCRTFRRQRFRATLPTSEVLPGIGEYTAAAVAAFAFGQRQAVLDTNVRRVHGRWLDGSEHPLTPTASSRERSRALQLLPQRPEGRRKGIGQRDGARRTGLCTSRTPQCSACPITVHCAWRRPAIPAGTGHHAGTEVGGHRPPVPWQPDGCAARVTRARDRIASLAHTWSDTEQRDERWRAWSLMDCRRRGRPLPASVTAAPVSLSVASAPALAVAVVSRTPRSRPAGGQDGRVDQAGWHAARSCR